MIMCVLLCYPISIHMSQLLSTGHPISSCNCICNWPLIIEEVIDQTNWPQTRCYIQTRLCATVDHLTLNSQLVIIKQHVKWQSNFTVACLI